MSFTIPCEKSPPAIPPGESDEHPDMRRPLLLQTGDFAEVLEYLSEWNIVDGPTRRVARHTSAGPMIAGNAIGPYCLINLSRADGPEHRAIAVRPTAATLDALRPRIVTDDDRLNFDVIALEDDGRAVIIASHDRIIGKHWLADVSLATLPPNPYAQRDERVQELCQALRDAGHTPYERRLQGGVIEIEPSPPGTAIKASVDVLGAVTRYVANGRQASVEQPRNPQEARRAAAQLAEHHALPATKTTAAAKANGRATVAPQQQPLFDREPGKAAASGAAPVDTDDAATVAERNRAAAVRRSRVADPVVDVLARSQVTDDLVVLPDQLDRDLYVKVNKTLAALGGKWNRRRGGHVFPAGQAIADELAAIIDGGVLERLLTGYFPTPRALATQLIELADVHPGHLVLEPSAGRGAIADPLALVVAAEQLYLVERDPTHHQALERTGYRAPQLICGDFLATSALPGAFDRIVMNPPFERKQDVAHVMHAYELLVPGGRLAAITSAGVGFREDAATRRLRSLIEHSDGSMLENAPDAFKASGTSVSTLTIALTKPRE
jgi:predicted RNA methylase